jgi:hypothetical protein
VNNPGSLRLGPLLLVLTYLLLGFLYSVIQPLGAVPDEAANMHYVQWLTVHHSLPPWVPTGENPHGGYESQHPPLAFALDSIPYALTRGLPENWRWQIVRWFMLVLGLGLSVPALRLGRLLFPTDPLPQLAYAATVLILPLTLLYLCHANPDGIGLILSMVGLWLAWQILLVDKSEDRKLPILSGLVAAGAALTKLSAMPIGIVLVAAQWLRPGQTRPERMRRCGMILGLWLVGAGWWYLRNLALYGRPFIHTAVANMGPGLTLAGRIGMGQILWFTLSETFLSFWAQRGWFPDAWSGILYGLIGLLILAAILGWVRGRNPIGLPRIFIGLCLFLPLSLFLGQQWAFWRVDMELNAGGRYLLIALPAIAVLLIAGVTRLGPRASGIILPLWIILLVILNIASAYHIEGILTPHYFPGWRMFEFPGGRMP